MGLSIADVAQGQVKGFPRYRELKSLVDHDSPVVFTLVTPEGEQEVRIWRWTARSTPGDGTKAHDWSLIVVPVDTFETDRAGARSVRIEVDADGNAIYV